MDPQPMYPYSPQLDYDSDLLFDLHSPDVLSHDLQPTATSSPYLLPLAFLLIPGLIYLLWTALTLLTSPATPSPSVTLFPHPPSLRCKRIVLLIAHPDDEAMFFSPTVLRLTKPELGNHVKILCLSSGNADGLGEVRKKELIKSALMLGVRRGEDVFVVDEDVEYDDGDGGGRKKRKRFADGMQENWKEEDVSDLLGEAFLNYRTPPSPIPAVPLSPRSQQAKADAKARAIRKADGKPFARRSLAATVREEHLQLQEDSESNRSNESSDSSSSSDEEDEDDESPTATIDVLITFDAHGISNHPNHKALYYGSRAFLNSLLQARNKTRKQKRTSWTTNPVALYTLPTVNLARKYSFIFDGVVTMGIAAVKRMRGVDLGDGGVMVVNDVKEYWKARGAMVEGHKSQMVWFRWGWIGIGRYMVINELRKERF